MELDYSDCLDLVPTLAFLFSHIPGKSVLIKALAYKESNRIFEIQNLLNLFKKENNLTRSFDLEIFGNSKKVPFLKFLAPKDHRMIMASYLFMRLNNGGIISNYKALNKSFGG